MKTIHSFRPIAPERIEIALRKAGTTEQRVKATLAANPLISADLKREQRAFVKELYRARYSYASILQYMGNKSFSYDVTDKFQTISDETFHRLLVMVKKIVKLQTYLFDARPGYHRRKIALANCIMIRSFAAAGYPTADIALRLGMNKSSVRHHLIGKCRCPIDKIALPVLEDEGGRIVRTPTRKKKTQDGEGKTWEQFDFKYRHASPFHKSYLKPSGFPPSSEQLSSAPALQKEIRYLRHCHLDQMLSDNSTGVPSTLSPTSGAPVPAQSWERAEEESLQHPPPS